MKNKPHLLSDCLAPEISSTTGLFRLAQPMRSAILTIIFQLKGCYWKIYCVI